MSTQGRVESAIRRAIRPGSTLTTPAREKPFVVKTMDSEGLVLLLGSGRYRVRVTWACIEGIPRVLRGRDWTVVGANFAITGAPGTLDGYLKAFVKVATASWLARVLELSDVVELDRGRPLRLRLRADFVQ